METTIFPDIPGAKKLSPLEMNKIDILKDHTVITFGTDKPTPDKKD